MTELRDCIRDVPDFPRKGILFKDITTLLNHPLRFKEVIDKLTQRYLDKKIDFVVAVEARGFILAGCLAYNLGAGVVPVRKKGKLPYLTHQATYQLEYGTDTLEIHQDAFSAGAKILIVDDLLATGGTVRAVIELIKKLNGNIVELTFMIELTFLNAREKIKDYPVFSLIKY